MLLYHSVVCQLGGASPPCSDLYSRAGIPTEPPALHCVQAVSRLRHSGRFSLPSPSISCGFVTASARVHPAGTSPGVAAYLTTIHPDLQVHYPHDLVENQMNIYISISFLIFTLPSVGLFESSQKRQTACRQSAMGGKTVVLRLTSRSGSRYRAESCPRAAPERHHHRWSRRRACRLP